VKRVLEHGVTITGASDHGVSEAVYFRDPDDNGVELYYDRAKKDWPRPSDGKGVAMFSEPLDVDALVAEAD
jgi:catechol 2,3-dioxygenase